MSGWPPPDPVDTVQWMTIAQAVDRTGVTTTQLRRWIREGRVVVLRHEGRAFVTWDSVVDEQRDSRRRRRGAGVRHAVAGRK